MWCGPRKHGSGRQEGQEGLFRLERGPGIALQAMQDKKALSSRGRGRLRGFLELRRLAGLSSALAFPLDLRARPLCRRLRGRGCANCQSLPQAELFVRQRERPGLFA